MFSQIFTIIFPLFAIVSIGFFYGRKHAPDMVSANQLNLDIFVPALILHVLADKSFQVDTYSQLAIGGAFVVIFSGFLAWPVAKLMGFNVKTFVPPMMFSNSGNIGLPLALFAFGEQALPAAVMLFIVENTLHFSLGMKMMDRKISLFSIVKIPMVFAVVIGTSSTLFITSTLLYLLGSRREKQGKAQLKPTAEEVKASLSHIP